MREKQVKTGKKSQNPEKNLKIQKKNPKSPKYLNLFAPWFNPGRTGLV